VLVKDIPYHLRNTVERLSVPIYIDLQEDACIPPAGRLALGDTLMVLGIIRNQGRPVRLHLEPPEGLRELVEGHPLVAELAPPAPERNRLDVRALPVGRSGRKVTWVSTTIHQIELPVLPVDQVRANPVLAHSLYYRLPRQDDRPSLHLALERPRLLAGLLGRGRPTLVVYPLNPGRGDSFWHEPGWWRRLLRELSRDFYLVAVGAPDYGELAEVVDAVLPMDDAASTLGELAALIGQAAGFLGRDGGLVHLAAAVQTNLVTVWDSMMAYRFWAGSTGHHLLMCNPYGFRYPQTCRLTRFDIKQGVRVVQVPTPEGGMREVELPREGYSQRVKELFGSWDQFIRVVLAQQEVEMEREAVAAWMGQEELRERVYQQSLAFAAAALRGQVPRGANWVVPVFP